MLFAKKTSNAALLLACLLLPGCADNPGKWPAEKLAEYVKQALIEQEIDVTEISLSPQADGSFQGTAKAADGETFTLLVTRDAAARRITWDAKGDRGSFLDGNYQLQ